MQTNIEKRIQNVIGIKGCMTDHLHITCCSDLFTKYEHICGFGYGLVNMTDDLWQIYSLDISVYIGFYTVYVDKLTFWVHGNVWHIQYSPIFAVTQFHNNDNKKSKRQSENMMNMKQYINICAFMCNN